MSFLTKTVAASILIIAALQISGCIAIIGGSSEPTYLATRQLTLPHEAGSGLVVVSRNGSITIKPTTQPEVPQFSCDFHWIAFHERLT
jgi:hypothetical protein